MSAFIYTVGYRSLIEPPPGHALLKTEVLRGNPDGPSEEEHEFYREMGIDDESLECLDDLIIFRGVVRYPDGNHEYFSAVLDSLVPLGKKAFWEEFWQDACKHHKRRRRYGRTSM